jgi:RNA polymerase sigma factor for flagellar operon FliA
MNAENRENIAAVWKDFFARRDHYSRNILIEHYLQSVKYTAQRLHCRLPKSVELDDLVSAGLMGLIKAIDKFDPGRGVLFETYCVGRIQGEILDDLRKKDWIPRLVRFRAQQLQKVTQKLESLLGREPTDTELAGDLGMKMEEFCHFRRDANAISLFSLDGCPSDSNSDNEFRVDTIANQHSQNPFHEAQKKDLKEYVTKRCSREEKLIIILYYYEQMTMKEIGMALGISESRVCQIHSLVIAKLKSHLSRQTMIEGMTLDSR